MPRILGINIPDNKKIEYSLPYVFGIGLSSSRVILRSANVDPNKRAKDLTADEMNRIQKIIEAGYKVEGDLRKDIGQNVKHMKEVGSWKGLRHARHLPIHGRSKTNSRTSRTPGPGPNVRKTMGSGRKPSSEKT
ncbi:MAG TPA: 30S ribosomal protein S13 [Candidatus Paceibacterota bacterium]